MKTVTGKRSQKFSPKTTLRFWSQFQTEMASAKLHDVPAYQTNAVVEVISREIDSRQNILHALSHEIHSHPELCFQEIYAHDYLTGMLDQLGFVVERHYKKIPTAFRAEIANASFNAAQDATAVICCEYDALPKIGHACGHNLIAECSMGTFLGVAAAIKEGLLPGRVVIIGTPAEEGEGGKIKLLDAGAFEDADFALMAHGGPVEIVCPNILGLIYATATFTGKAAHAAAGPWEGINALDACVASYNSLSMLRQQIQPSNRIHVIIVEGGVKANIIPERAVMQIGFRSPVPGELDELVKRGTRIVELAAESHRCRVEIVHEHAAYKPMLHNRILGELYEKYAQKFGTVFEVDARVMNSLNYSTDMGDVSQQVPSIHPSFVPCPSAVGVTLHTEKFRDVVATDAAQQGTLRTAKALACAAAEVLADSSLLKSIKAEFEGRKKD